MMIVIGATVAGVTVMSRETRGTETIATPTVTPVTAPATLAPVAPPVAIEPAPVKPAPVEPVAAVTAPAAPGAPDRQKIHAVLIRTYPNAALVTVDGRSFGTTPTYVKIPGNTPVEVRITRAGFRPVTRVVTSKSRFEQVFVPLQRKGNPKAKKRGVDLSDI